MRPYRYKFFTFYVNNVNSNLTVKCLLCIFRSIAKKSIYVLKWNSKKNSSYPKEGSKHGTKGNKTEGKSKNQIKHEL